MGIKNEKQFSENNLAVKDFLLDGPSYGKPIEMEVIKCPNE